MKRIAIVGGGAAGFFAAITAAETDAQATIFILEKTGSFLTKVRISGGGRCNVTNSCTEIPAFVQRYPRGRSALHGPLHQFGPLDTIDWFRKHGVQLKTEPDGRMFPTTDTSQTIIDALLGAASSAGIQLRLSTPIRTIRKIGPAFQLDLSSEESLEADRVILATGGCRAPAAAALAVALGHSLEPPVPSLFAFDLAPSFLHELPGVSVDPVRVTLPEIRIAETGPLLITHRGLSGPVILRLSAWGARRLHECDYRFPLRIDWLPETSRESLAQALEQQRETHGRRRVAKAPAADLPARLWEKFCAEAQIDPELPWSRLRRDSHSRLVGLIKSTELHAIGKTMNQDEFVTCGGIPLREVNLRTMESRICPGLFFAGELLDIDGLTGGFNFQAAWTTGSIAGRSAAV
jgi:predicted Rossmann fold flavoprotein